MNEIKILIIVLLNMSMLVMCFRNIIATKEGKVPYKDKYMYLCAIFLSAPAVYVARLIFNYNQGNTKFFIKMLPILALNLICGTLLFIL